ncbi:MAG: hypothetical protein BWK79_03070 [Beggiatoa sp. IS2]|nr:MAG: hypothetical protein BWK79_03070 [Beggiatoa sp. IS2]
MKDLVTEYDRDFNAWIQQHITLLKQGRVNEIDVEHLIIELEDMGKSNLRELESRLVILIAHLLKWQFQLKQLNELWEEFKGNSWQQSIIEQRYKINKLLKTNPSLKSHVQDAIVNAYPDALEIAIDETGLPQSTFPESCSYTAEQLLDKTFYPDKSSG